MRARAALTAPASSCRPRARRTWPPTAARRRCGGWGEGLVWARLAWAALAGRTTAGVARKHGRAGTGGRGRRKAGARAHRLLRVCAKSKVESTLSFCSPFLGTLRAGAAGVGGAACQIGAVRGRHAFRGARARCSSGPPRAARRIARVGRPAAQAIACATCALLIHGRGAHFLPFVVPEGVLPPPRVVPAFSSGSATATLARLFQNARGATARLRLLLAGRTAVAWRVERAILRRLCLLQVGPGCRGRYKRNDKLPPWAAAVVRPRARLPLARRCAHARCLARPPLCPWRHGYTPPAAPSRRRRPAAPPRRAPPSQAQPPDLRRGSAAS